jgi:hypothetical protein
MHLRPRRLTAAAVAAGLSLSVLAGTGTAVAAPDPGPSHIATPYDASSVQYPGSILWLNRRPVFNNYLVCVGSWMYADFYDPDGGDENLTVTLAAFFPATGWTYRTMGVSGPGAHGVFFYLDRGPAGVLGASAYAVRATDPQGSSSAWVYADAACNVS